VGLSEDLFGKDDIVLKSIRTKFQLWVMWIIDLYRFRWKLGNILVVIAYQVKCCIKISAVYIIRESWVFLHDKRGERIQR